MTKQKKMYSIGSNDVNYFNLGISQIEASDVTIYYREITAFRGFNIVDFAAGHRTSHVIIEGDKELLSNVNEHKLGDTVSKGPLHFFYDSTGALQTVTSEEFESKKDTLPDITFAIKCPVESLADCRDLLPDLKELAKEYLNYEEGAINTDVKCDVTGKLIEKEVRYVSVAKINGDEQLVNLSERAYMAGANQFDINPLIYYRLNKPLKEDANLPVLDLTMFYRESANYGIDITVVPKL